jgi:GntR family transcriptional regulator, transcriptional repressor for pyruvate dehydrogenase complex
MLAGWWFYQIMQRSIMQITFEPLKVQSLKEACVSRLEQLILSGELKIGEQLPSERDFALRLGVSRPVLHAALVDLDAKGLVQIVPRRGVFVNDFRRSGSMAILGSLLTYHDGNLDPALIRSLIEMRKLVETETARLAAVNCTEEQLAGLRSLLDEEARAASEAVCDPQTLTTLDFSFHLSIAIASGNLIYPLIINSFQGVYTHLTGQFFSRYCGTPVAEAVRQFHLQIVEAFERREAETAVDTMTAMLNYGATYLQGERP